MVTILTLHTQSFDFHLIIKDLLIEDFDLPQHLISLAVECLLVRQLWFVGSLAVVVDGNIRILGIVVGYFGVRFNGEIFRVLFV